MTRHLAAYLILGACLLVLAIALLFARHYSRGQVLRRRRLADEVRWADQAREREG